MTQSPFLHSFCEEHGVLGPGVAGGPLSLSAPQATTTIATTNAPALWLPPAIRRDYGMRSAWTRGKLGSH